MRRPLLRAALLPAAACTLAAAPTGAAHAQRGLMGAIKRRVGEEVVAGAGGGRSAAAPAFDERVLEITDARLDQLLAGLRAEAAARDSARRGTATELARRDGERQRYEAYQRCGEPFRTRNLALVNAAAAAAAAGKRDSAAALMARTNAVEQQKAAACGPEPDEPAFGEMGGAASAGDPFDAAAARARLRRDQYAILRERVVAFLGARGRDAGPFVFAPAERAALERRAADFAPYRELLQGRG